MCPAGSEIRYFVAWATWRSFCDFFPIGDCYFHMPYSGWVPCTIITYIQMVLLVRADPVEVRNEYKQGTCPQAIYFSNCPKLLLHTAGNQKIFLEKKFLLKKSS